MRHLSISVHTTRTILMAIALAVTVTFVACGSDPTPQLLPTATPLPPTATPPPFRGQWITLEDDTDPLTRVGEARIALVAKEAEMWPSLRIRCQEDEFNLYELDFIIDWSETPIAKRNSSWGVTVQHRIDDGPVESLEWNYSTDHTATFLPKGRIADMIKKLFDAKEFVAQINTNESDTITAVFEPAGLYWTVKPVLAACGQEID